jgi:hypothetical protein
MTEYLGSVAANRRSLIEHPDFRVVAFQALAHQERVGQYKNRNPMQSQLVQK